MAEKHIVRARVFNIDANEYEEQEFEVSDDVYKIITNRIGKHYSLGVEVDSEERVGDWRREIDYVRGEIYWWNPNIPRSTITDLQLVLAYNYNALFDEAHSYGVDLRNSGMERTQASTDSDD